MRSEKSILVSCGWRVLETFLVLVVALAALPFVDGCLRGRAGGERRSSSTESVQGPELPPGAFPVPSEPAWAFALRIETNFSQLPSASPWLNTDPTTTTPCGDGQRTEAVGRSVGYSPAFSRPAVNVAPEKARAAAVTPITQPTPAPVSPPEANSADVTRTELDRNGEEIGKLPRKSNRMLSSGLADPASAAAVPGGATELKAEAISLVVHQTALAELGAARSNVTQLEERIVFLEGQLKDLGSELRELERRQFVIKAREAREESQREPRTFK